MGSCSWWFGWVLTVVISLFAFWLSKDNNYQPYDIAAVWTTIEESTRQQILADYHAAGKTLRVSVLGSSDYPLKYGGDPTTIAQKVASFVNQYGLDGVDVRVDAALSSLADHPSRLTTRTATRSIPPAMARTSYHPHEDSSA